MLCLAAVKLRGARGRKRSAIRRFVREAGSRSLFTLQTLHFYLYARWTKQYLLFAAAIVTRLGRPCKRWLARHYHGKVLTHEHARAILVVDRPIPLRDLEQIIPYPVARQFLLDSPLEMLAYECPCRHARPHPCQPTQVCLIIGQPFVDFLLEHHPEDCRRLTRAEALTLLEEEHLRGHVHCAWFKDACLDRFFAICNCCKCCCGGIEAMVRHNIPMMTSSGYVARIDPSSCAGCGRCQRGCPFDAIHVDGYAVVEYDRCLGCGVCVVRCERGAVSLIRDAGKGVPLDVRLMS